MEILFLSSLCQDSQEDDLISNSTVGLQNSIIGFQWSIINGIEENINKSINIVNILPVGTYPRHFKKLLIKHLKWNHAKDADDITIGLVNLPVIKQIMLTIKAKVEITNWINKNQGKNLCIIMYDLLFPYLIALKSIRKKYPSIITCSIIADLPNEYGYQKNDKGIFKYLRIIMGKIQLQEVKKMDCYGLLTEQMKYPLTIDEDAYVIIEGIANPKGAYEEITNDEKNIILYTGSLNCVYGIDKLINAFMMIKEENYELWICGTGNYQSEIIDKSNTDSRIKYFGYCSKKVISELQAKSTVLINPRQNIGEYTKYSFPSKIMEYLAAGRPVIAYRLDGIPDEYYKYIICPEDNSIEKLRETLLRVCNMSLQTRQDIGNSGRRFVIEKKNPKAQCKELIELIDTQYFKKYRMLN